MSRSARRGFVVCTLLGGLATQSGCVADAGRTDPQAVGPKQFRQGQVIVTLSSNTLYDGQATTHLLSQQYGLSEAGSFPLTSIRLHCAVFQVPAGQGLDQVLRQLKEDSRVDLAEANQEFELALDPQDHSSDTLEYAAAATHADAAHLLSTGKGVRVAVVDTGVDTRHQALKDHVTGRANFVEGGERSFDDDRHGTAVAGVIGGRSDRAAREDHGSAFLGIAPDAEMLAAKACWYSNRNGAKAVCSSWTLAKAIDLAINSGTQVLNLSLSGPSDALLERLLVEADRRGITVIAAAAEQGPNIGFPAMLPTVIPVVASDPTGQVSASGWNDRKSAIAAPGVDILTTVPGDGYDILSGSSLAAAHMTGVVALLLQQKPALSPGDVRKLLEQTAHPIIGRSSTPTATSLGLVDACAALNAVLGTSGCH